MMKCCGRPEYAPDSSDEEEEEAVEFKLTKQQQVMKVAADVDHDMKLEAERDDRRLRRLQDRQQEEVDSDEDREARYITVYVCIYRHVNIFSFILCLGCYITPALSELFCAVYMTTVVLNYMHTSVVTVSELKPKTAFFCKPTETEFYDGQYDVFISLSTHLDSRLNYGQCIINDQSQTEFVHMESVTTLMHTHTSSS